MMGQTKRQIGGKNIWRDDFPMLRQTAYGRPLIYLDNAATTQQPACVIRCMKEYSENRHSNIHRGAHYFSNLATTGVEDARKRVAAFLHANEPEEVIFTSGTTESISLAANGLRFQLGTGKAIISTQLEHHSDFVPWQQICRQTGSTFLTCSMDENGDLDLNRLEDLLRQHAVFLVAVTQVSNVTGAVTPIRDIISLCHRYGAKVLIDGAQGVRHEPCHVAETDCDFYAFSAHKMMGPTGVGVLYGKRELLELLEPLRYGGGMVDLVTEEETSFGSIPFRLEGGTPNIGGMIAFGECVRYLQEAGPETLAAYEDSLMAYLEKRLKEVEGIRILCHPKKRSGCISFVGERFHAYDIASFLDKQGIAVRSGNLCAQPLLARVGVSSVVRISPAFYNTYEEIDACIDALQKTISLLEKLAPK
ncbi:MAG: SufS family cysteine desulfurase [Clostridiales bacterium]|nr:SufS family cysteine desulfurase [Clostridiales bacterium]